MLSLLIGLAMWNVGGGLNTKAASATPATQANTITVTNTNDSGPGSLRQAIADAAPGDTINFNLSDCPCVITLTSGELLIRKPLTINGPGAKTLSIDGNNNSRVFSIIQSGTVTLAGLTVTKGNGVGATNNSLGGGILGLIGTLIINDCAIVGNSTLSGAAGGGGVFFAIGALRMTGSVISGNRAGFGGGIETRDNTGSLTNCTISGNSAIGFGGGILISDRNFVTDLTLTNCTVTGNSGPRGVVHVESRFAGVSTARLKNTLVAGNSPPNFGKFVIGSSSATLTSLGHNLEGDGSSGFTNSVNGDLVGTMSNPLDALLGPLADNGGPTQTHALLLGSPAINAGNNAFALDADSNPLQFDQRGPGFPRILGGAVDIGAFERPLYNFNGFFPPVENPPVFNNANAGRATPIKFSLGGDQGLNIFVPGHPVSQQIACSDGAPSSEVEQTVTAGGSSLSYDAETDTYTYVWKTEKSWAGTCRKLIVRLNDGSEHLAFFKFK
jgi:hypothetical protein